MGITMGLNATVQFRTSSTIKDGAFAVFEEMGISPSAALQLFLQQVQKTRTLPFIVTANPAMEEKEDGYDDWLRARLERTIQLVDSGKMPTYTTMEVRQHMKERRAKWRSEKNSVTSK
jgi:DNA-damage-inducible protein J/RHH-type rel operon transcriptional repressor/antitoxin RelB